MNTKNILTAALVVGLLAVAVPALAQTTSISATTKIACVGTAVNAREQSLDTAITAFGSAQNSAYSARASALSAAYQASTAAGVRTAVRAAWSAFTASMKTARTNWRDARNSAWSTFRTAATACKAPAGVSDSAHSDNEAAGN